KPEEAVGSGDRPVGQGRLLVVARVVQAGLDPVAALPHLPRDERVAGPGGAGERPRAQAPGGGGRGGKGAARQGGGALGARGGRARLRQDGTPRRRKARLRRREAGSRRAVPENPRTPIRLRTARRGRRPLRRAGRSGTREGTGSRCRGTTIEPRPGCAGALRRGGTGPGATLLAGRARRGGRAGPGRTESSRSRSAWRRRRAAAGAGGAS